MIAKKIEGTAGIIGSLTGRALCVIEIDKDAWQKLCTLTDAGLCSDWILIGRPSGQRWAVGSVSPDDLIRELGCRIEKGLPEHEPSVFEKITQEIERR